MGLPALLRMKTCFLCCRQACDTPPRTSAGAGISVVFGSLIDSVARNTSLTKQLYSALIVIRHYSHQQEHQWLLCVHCHDSVYQTSKCQALSYMLMEPAQRLRTRTQDGKDAFSDTSPMRDSVL